MMIFWDPKYAMNNLFSPKIIQLFDRYCHSNLCIQVQINITYEGNGIELKWNYNIPLLNEEQILKCSYNQGSLSFYEVYAAKTWYNYILTKIESLYNGNFSKYLGCYANKQNVILGYHLKALF